MASEKPLPLVKDQQEDGSKRKATWVPLDRPQNEQTFNAGWLWHLLSLLALAAFVSVIYLSSSLKNHPNPMSLLKWKIPERRTQMKPVAESEKKEETQSKSMLPTLSKLFQKLKPGADHAVQRSPDIGKPPVLSAQSANPVPVTHEPILTHTDKFEQSERNRPPENVLEKIRKDPRRIYLDKKFVFGDLSYEIRNVSEHGIELYVSNDEDAQKTYYFPKVIVGDSISQFEGSVLAPGKGSYGWIRVPDIKQKRKLSFEFSAVGGERRKESLKIGW